MHLDVFLALKAIESQNVLAHRESRGLHISRRETEFHTGWMTVLAQITNFEVVCYWKSQVRFLSGVLETSQVQTKEIQGMKSKSDCSQSRVFGDSSSSVRSALVHSPHPPPCFPFPGCQNISNGWDPFWDLLLFSLSLSLSLFLTLQRIRILSCAWRHSLTSLHKIVSSVSISSSPQSWYVLSSYHFFSLN